MTFYPKSLPYGLDLGAIWYAAHGTFKTHSKAEGYPSKHPEPNGINSKLKNYLPLKPTESEIKVVATSV